MWAQFNNQFWYKEMKYQNSCFPCSLHTILANLGYAGHNGTGIEDLWDQLHQAGGQAGGLNASAPNEIQVHQYLSQTPELGTRGVVYTPTNLATQADANTVCQRIQSDFVNSNRAVGLIAGINHAEVFFKTNTGQFITMSPSPDMQNIFCDNITISQVRTLSGQNEFAAGIDYVYSNGDVRNFAANFIMIIS